MPNSQMKFTCQIIETPKLNIGHTWKKKCPLSIRVIILIWLQPTTSSFYGNTCQMIMRAIINKLIQIPIGLIITQNCQIIIRAIIGNQMTNIGDTSKQRNHRRITRLTIGISTQLTFGLLPPSTFQKVITNQTMNRNQLIIIGTTWEVSSLNSMKVLTWRRMEMTILYTCARVWRIRAKSISATWKIWDTIIKTQRVFKEFLLTSGQ